MPEDDRDKLFDLLDQHYSYTGLSLTKEPHVYTFFLEDDVNPASIPGLPSKLLRRLS